MASINFCLPILISSSDKNSFGDNNLKGTTIRRSRSQRKLQRQVSNDANLVINSSFNCHNLNHTKTDVRIEGGIKETCGTTKLSVLQKKYSRNFKINQKLGINLKTNQSHNFRPGASNNAATVTYDQNQDFNKRRFFPKGILKDDNGAAVKQDQSRLAHLATPKSLPYRNCMFGTDQQNKPVTSYSVGKQNHCI